METVVLVTFKIKGILTPVKIASKTAPSQERIYHKLADIAKGLKLEGDVEFKKLIQEKDKKMFIYMIGDTKCVVTVEKLMKVMEFETIE